MLIKFLISLNLFDLKMVIIPGITQSIIIIVALFFYIISDNALGFIRIYVAFQDDQIVECEKNFDNQLYEHCSCYQRGE